MKIDSLLLSIAIILGTATYSFATFNGGNHLDDPYSPEYVISTDTIIPLSDRLNNSINTPYTNPFDLNDPSVIEKNVEYDPATGNYIISEKIGEDFYRMPTYMSFDEYLDYRAKEQEKDYFQQLSGVSSGGRSSSGRADPISKFDIKNSLADRLFGGTEVDIRPQGNIDLTFGVDYNKVQNERLTRRQQVQSGFDFDMNIQMNVVGKIGEKLNLSTNYNTQATFGFENQMKLEYNSDAFSEDEIIKKIEAGNVSLPLRGTLIQGSQSLFGLKTELQFGALRLTAIASQQKSEREQISIQGGSQLQEFEVKADEYDENRHFFLTHYNRDNYERSLENMPQINSLFKITKLKVFITNDRNETEEIRDIVAIADIGEPQRVTNKNPRYQGPSVPRHRDISGRQALPGKIIGSGAPESRALYANDLLYDIQNTPNSSDVDRVVSLLENNFGLIQTQDFEKVTARELRPSEYTFHPELGFLSVNVNIQPDQVLGISFEYQYNGETFQVGTQPNDTYDPENLGVLFVKMLKSSTQRIDLATWDLMMKNVYSLGAFNVNPDDFLLDIYYEDPGKGEKRFLSETNLANVPLLRVFNLDRLNVQSDVCPDGIFDFVPGVTINPRNGRIYFPVLEPFGSNLVEDMEPEFRKKFEYFHLYDSTITRAREYPEFNRFSIRGTYKSSVSSEISLGSFNLPEGSVRVTAGGQVLREGVDYEVDYNIGRVKILNDAYINSGNPINVSFEDNTLFGLQSKTMLGVRADYELNKDFNIGATYMHLFERPFTQKVNIGDDPISNKVYGLDVNFTKDAPWLTKMVDKIPLINTKEPSSITFSAEAAALRPGHAKAVNLGRNEEGKADKSGIVFIDDFEGSTSSFDLRTPTNAWVLSSVPQGDNAGNNNLFPESKFIDTTLSGVNRAKINWYRIDESVRNNTGLNPYSARIPQTEVFPNLSVRPGFSNIIQTFDLTYYPEERGPYNFDLPGGTDYSAGIREGNGEILLNQPETRWGGIMRSLNTNDFQAANIEYLEFWVLNPFMEGENPGNLYINLGSVSEDILRDSRKFFENGVPTDEELAENPNLIDVTNWGLIPRRLAITNAFDNDVDKRIQQDVGLDGFNNDGERAQFDDYIQTVTGALPGVAGQLQADPSNDDYLYFDDPIYNSNDADLFERYSDFNNPEGNSKTAGDNNRLQSATNLPDSEDLNRDNSLNETEAYFQYKIPLEPVDGPEGFELDFSHRYITDSIHQKGISSGNQARIWYRFKVPLDQYTDKIGGIQDFRSIRFIRMYMHGFQRQATLRFARLELTRNQWRRYRRPLQVLSSNDPSVGACCDDGQPLIFDVNAVNIEENITRTPFGYVLPPGISREQSNQSVFPDVLQNEQSLTLEICNLQPDSAVGIYKILNLDMRVYEKMEMFVHLEQTEEDMDLEDNDLALIMRLGSDFENNYYEYELPLVLSEPSDTNRNNLSEEYALAVWRSENNLKIPLREFIELKKARNASGISLIDIYEQRDTTTDLADTIFVKDRFLRVKGNPNLGLIKGAMIGVVNRGDESHCTEVWVNELRLSGFDEEGGVAAIARLDLKLADFGLLTASTSYTSQNWGQLEQNVQDRSREEIVQFDLAANLELGKFFGDKSGIKIPAYASYSQTTSSPEFDPYDLDIPLKEKLAATADPVARDSIKKQAEDFISIKSLNFTNVRKEKTNTSKKPAPWDIENFSFTYAYTQTEKRNPIIKSDKLDSHYGAIDYGFNMQPLYLSPFKKLSKSKHLKLITDINLNLIPNSFRFSTALDREFQETEYRFTDLDPRFNKFYNKQFSWDRQYDLKWDLSKALKFNFNASNQAIIDELKQLDPVTFQARGSDVLKEKIWNGLRSGGRNKNYQHNVNANYTLPFKQIPVLDWINVRASYSASYVWAGSSVGFEGGPGIADSLGNVISNTQVREINGDFNFEGLYKKWKYLDKINKKRKTGKSTRGRTGTTRGTREGANTKGNREEAAPSKGTRGERGKTKNESSDGPATKGKDSKGKTAKELAPNAKPDFGAAETDEGALPVDENDKPGKKSKKSKKGKDKKADIKDLKSDIRGGKGTQKEKAKKDKPEREPSVVERVLIRPLMILRKARFSYTENFGTVLPGYMPGTEFFGQTNNFSTPGWGFVSGLQPDISPVDGNNDFLDQAAAKGWLSENIFLNQQVGQDYSQRYNGNLSLEPFNDFRIDVDLKKDFQENSLLYYKDLEYDGIEGNFEDLTHANYRQINSMTISYFAMQTLFQDSEPELKALFNTFEENRIVISQRLGTSAHENPDFALEGYTEGYGRIQEDILIPAFLAAYTGQDPNLIEVSDNFTKELFNIFPKPNWKLTYNGLGKLDIFKDVFQNFKISHSYSSQLRVNQIATDLAFNQEQPLLKDEEFNFYSRFELPSIVITEQFSPLIGIDMQMKNGMDLSVDLKKSRDLSMSFTSFGLTETKTTEFVIGFGYTAKDVYLAFLYGKNGRKRKPRGKRGAPTKDDTKDNPDAGKNGQGGGAQEKGNDLNFKFDFSFRDDVSGLHQLDQGIYEETRGLTSITISPSIDYDINKRLNARLFFDYRRTTPKTSQGFPTTNAQGGVTIRFSLN